MTALSSGGNCFQCTAWNCSSNDLLAACCQPNFGPFSSGCDSRSGEDSDISLHDGVSSPASPNARSQLLTAWKHGAGSRLMRSMIVSATFRCLFVIIFSTSTPPPWIPTVTPSVPGQQLHPAYTMTTVTTDDNFDTTGLVHPQFSFTAVEDFWPLVVGSLPPLHEFDAPVYNRIHQEQIVAGEMPQHRVEQEQAIVQEIPQASIVEWIQEQIVDSNGLVIPQFSITGVEVSAPQAVGSCPPSE